MTEYYSIGAGGNLARNAQELFTAVGDDVLAPEYQLESFVRLNHAEVIEWLPGAKGLPKTAMTRIWKQAQVQEKKLKKKYEKTVPISSKLMYCWVQEARKQRRITEEQAIGIIDELPNLVPLPKASTNPESAAMETDGDNQSTSTTHESPAMETDGENRAVAEYLAQGGEEPIVVVEDEEQDNATKEKGYTPMNVMCHEAVFYTKTSNIERQLEGSVFDRSEKLFKMYAKDSKAMIAKAVKKNKVFDADW
jgi:hypothetical protein